jgi:hypothetical protein
MEPLFPELGSRLAPFVPGHPPERLPGILRSLVLAGADRAEAERGVRSASRMGHMRYKIYDMRMSAATTVRVSRDTLAELERVQRALQTTTADETIRAVLKMQRAALIDRLSGSLRGRVSRFREADRLDSDR